jgi:hypothetical protein
MNGARQRSELIDRLLAQHGTPTGDSRAVVHPCEGAKFHSPTPLVTICYELPSGRQVWLCPTCEMNLKCFTWLYKHAPHQLSWDVMREFGNTIRLLGQEIVRSQQSEEHHE